MNSGVAGPGWYADPAGGGGLRWWDGQAWTLHVSLPAPGPQPWPYDPPPGSDAPTRISPIVPVAITLAVLALVAVSIVAIGRTASSRAARRRNASASPAGSTGATSGPEATTPTTVAPPQPSVPVEQMQLEDMSKPPSLPLRSSAEEGMVAAGLSPLNGDVMYHFHVHLEVFMMGGAVTVPAQVGIDQKSGALSPVHTHDTSGIIHVESGALEPYTLGQFFTEWGEPLGSDSIGHIHSRPGYTISWFVNGQRVSDPAAVALHPHDVIVAYEDGDSSAITPPGYTWPDGF